MSLAATMAPVERGRFTAEVQRAPRATVAPMVRRWMVMAFCPITGPWRQLVHAESAAGAIVKYCAEHDLSPDQCQAAPD
jgi:hypothetical protein